MTTQALTVSSASSSSLSKVRTALAITNKLLPDHAPTPEDWAWWHGLGETWKKIFADHVQVGQNTPTHPRQHNWQLWGDFDLKKVLQITQLAHIAGYFALYDDDLACLSSNMGFLAHLIHLKQLDLENCGLFDFYDLSALTELTQLNLARNHIKNIQPLAHLTTLHALNLDWNDIDDIGALSNLVQLTELHLYGNHIKDLKPLQNLSNLQKLTLHNNDIDCVVYLSNLYHLTELNLGSNNIKNLEPLSNLTQLQSLILFDNYIEDISPLMYLTNLKYLDLGYNTINTKQIKYLQKNIPQCTIAIS